MDTRGSLPGFQIRFLHLKKVHRMPQVLFSKVRSTFGYGFFTSENDTLDIQVRFVGFAYLISSLGFPPHFRLPFVPYFNRCWNNRNEKNPNQLALRVPLCRLMYS